MVKYDWKEKIKTNMLMLKMTGLWPEEDHYTLLYLIYAAILLSTFMFLVMILQIINIYVVRNDLAAVTGTFYVLLVEMLCVFKVYYFATNMEMFRQLLKTLETDMFQPKNDQQIRAIDNNIRIWKVIYGTYLYTCCGVNTFWAVYPFLDGSASRDKRLPFLVWYPYDVTSLPLYIATYIHQILSFAVITCVHMNIDALVAALNVFNGSQFDILRDNLINLHKIEGKFISVRQNLISCIHHHQQILSYADKSNKFLNWILVIQFSVSAVAIGITFFQLSLVTATSTEFFSLATYAVAITSQIFMYCWFGNEIEVKSSNISYATFECDWVGFPQDVKKSIIFFNMKVQMPVKLSALNLFYLSLDTFTKIMKTAWSYFALLHNVSSMK